MGLIGGPIGYHLLRVLGRRRQAANALERSGPDSSGDTLSTHFGDGLADRIRDKVVMDFGCGQGRESVQLARLGARKVIGVDIRERQLKLARERAARLNVSDRCQFVKCPAEKADIIVSKDSFEHFARPGEILRTMEQFLEPDGQVLIAFGPTWYHPLGGHLFSVFPWAHLIFTEAALIRWRADFKHDGASRFSEVEGGLNQMTIRRFRRVVAESPFEMETLQAVPIRALRLVHCRHTAELTTSIVRCSLVKGSRQQVDMHLSREAATC